MDSGAINIVFSTFARINPANSATTQKKYILVAMKEIGKSMAGLVAIVRDQCHSHRKQ